MVLPHKPRFFSRNPEAGFTLVELSVVVAILSLLLTGGLVVGTNVVQQQSLVGTRNDIKTLENAIMNYAVVNGRMPCVSSLGVDTTNGLFGTEVANCSTVAAPVPAGTFRVTTPSPIRIGGVPTRTLGLPDSAAADKFGNRYLYAVTESQTGSDFINPAMAGNITVRDRAGNVITNQAAFVLVSHGSNGLGAFKHATGIQSSPVGAPGTAYSDDRENADIDGNFLDTRFSDGTATNYFDDIITFKPKYLITALGGASGGSGTDELWTESPTSTQDTILVGQDGNFATGGVGIGTQDPLSVFEVVSDNLSPVLALPLSPSGAGNDFIFTRYQSTNDWAPLTMRYARGTQTSPQVLQNGDWLGGWWDVGYIDPAGAPPPQFVSLNQIHGIYEGNGTNQLSSLIFSTSNNGNPTEKMRITSAGRVGIGTGTPAQALHIPSPVVGDSTQVQVGQGAGSLFLTGPDAVISGNLRYDDATWRHEATGPGSALHFTAAGGDLSFITAPSAASTAPAAMTERMRLTNQGWLGIGKSPTRMLDVNGPASVFGDLRVTRDTLPDEGGAIRLDQSRLPGESFVSIDAYDNGGGTFGSRMFRVFPVDNGVAEVYKGMYLDLSNGNLGVGTFAPVQKLNVDGNIQINNQLGGWSYNLMFDSWQANTDNVYFQRYNADTNYTGFLLVIGDDYGSPLGAGGDYFAIVTNRNPLSGNPEISPAATLFQVQSNGQGYLNGALIQTSDRRFKKDIRSLEKYGLETVMALKPSIFKTLTGNEDKLGFIAQDIQNLIPELVTVYEDAHAEKSLKEIKEDSITNQKNQELPTSKLTLEYNGLIPVLTNAIQELKQQHDALSEKVDAAGVGKNDAPTQDLRALYALMAMLAALVGWQQVKIQRLSKAIRPH